MNQTGNQMNMKNIYLTIFIICITIYSSVSIAIRSNTRTQNIRHYFRSNTTIKENINQIIENIAVKDFNRTISIAPHRGNSSISTAGGCGLQSIEWKWCSDVIKKFHFDPLVDSDDKLPELLRFDWRKKNCANLFKHRSICSQPITQCSNRHHDLHNSSSSNLPLIAILAGTTTRRVVNPHTDKIALFTLLLPSLIRSIDCGYRYVYVMGYDKGDPFYDSDEGMNEVLLWWFEQIEKPMKRNGITITLEPVEVNNVLKKPGPVFLEMARRAYHLGAHYFYRVNDDTEFKGHWPKLYIHGLLSLGPPYGVIGPSSLGSKDEILTHDFVHRIHMEIFEMNYYPVQLTDWWMDNWISFVYGKKRTYISFKAAVVHHIYAHGQRYEVDRSNERFLHSAIMNGKRLIRNWMLKHNMSDYTIQQFDSDKESQFKIPDISTLLNKNTKDGGINSNNSNNNNNNVEKSTNSIASGSSGSNGGGNSLSGIGGNSNRNIKTGSGNGGVGVGGVVGVVGGGHHKVGKGMRGKGNIIHFN